jgi:hypothetical protein
MPEMHLKQDQLVDEFHVQVYASGRIDWDRLDAFLARNAPARGGAPVFPNRLAAFHPPSRRHAGHASFSR